ncbi:MAG: sulfite exporter TauE/SafE family protein [Pseudomonadota bacterium]
MIFALGIFIGLVMGLTGAGGSILVVPLLMAATGWGLQQVAPTALLAVASAAGLGAYLAWRKSQVRYRAATLMAFIGAFTAPLGLAAAGMVSSAVLSLLFVAILGLVSVRLWRQVMNPVPVTVTQVLSQRDLAEGQQRLCRLNDSSGRLIWTSPCALCISITGAVTGFLSGLLGVGGGFFIVPALHSATELSMHSAVGTSLMAIALTSFGALLGAVWQGHTLTWALAWPLMGGALLGISLGRQLAPKLAGARLQLAFASLVSLVALGMAVRATGLV